ncbi:MAG: aminoglycoside phosphotransferase family protein [Deltaproteobacteria bacterium]|nr:aminoglycoside phosphotransferase family protein [Deltaproteobacteria bacterium]
MAEGLLGRLRDILGQGYGLGAGGAAIRRLDSGRVNETYLATLESGETYVLQRLNAFFGSAGAIGENWDRVGRALGGAGVGFPRIFATVGAGWLYVEPGGDSHWRLTGFLEGRPPGRESLGDARLAARTLGLCHRALNVPRPIELLEPLDNADFTNQKRCEPGDFEFLFKQYRGHPHLGSVSGDIKRGGEAARLLPNRPAYLRIFAARDLVVHRDCKADNFLIGEARHSLIDWDTVGYGDPLLDIGEMCRSWAVSPVAPFYRADLAAAIVEGYRETGLRLSADEYRLLPATVRGLAVNLARRYLTDALAEAYFQWDRDAYPSLYEQNRSRGRHMLDLAEELLDREMELIKI